MIKEASRLSYQASKINLKQDNQITNWMMNPPSIDLLDCIKEAINTIGSFVDKWQIVLDKGQAEGFTPEELRDLARPYLKRLDLNRNQINYLFNSESIKERNTANYRANRPPNQPKLINQPINDNNNTDNNKTVVEVGIVDQYYESVVNLLIETGDLNLNLPITVRVYDDKHIELLSFRDDRLSFNG